MNQQWNKLDVQIWKEIQENIYHVIVVIYTHLATQKTEGHDDVNSL